MASDVEQSKKQMRIALVGVRPADQVTLKGYLRVLLRLDVELAWVSATDAPIDLFMINDEFRGVASVTKLLQVNQGVPVLYVNRLEMGDGGISHNVLTLPLKQINLLNDWLIRYVPVLSGLSLPAVNNADVLADRPVANEAFETAGNEQDFTQLLALIKQLQARPQESYELCDDGQVIAVIEASRQRVWLRTNTPTLSINWSLRPYQGQMLDLAQSVDLVAWLWQMAWQYTDDLLALVDGSERYQIRYWVKPPMNEMRRNLLQVMTLMEVSAVSLAEISSRTGVSMAFAKKVVASLLFAGVLKESTYLKLKVPSKIEQNVPPLVEKLPEPEPAPTPQQEEKLGFLARLRRKLGL